MTTRRLVVVAVLIAMFAATSAAVAHATTTVLDPGPGTDYLDYWCGGQQVNEIATGFDVAANAVTLVTTVTALSSGQVTDTACVEADNCATTTTNLP